MTPEAFVLDDKGQVRYHGRIDDQYVARRVRNAAPSGSELKDAIAAVLDGKEVAAPHVAAIGCPIPEAPEAPSRPTYTKDVAADPPEELPGMPSPGPGRARSPSKPTSRPGSGRRTSPTVVEDRLMPPWKASPHVGVKFKDERLALRQGHRHHHRLVRGRCSGRRSRDLPPPPKFADDWQLGTPDLIVGYRRGFRDPRLGGRHLPLLRDPDQAGRRISTSRRSSTGPAIAGSSITSWLTWTSRARPGSGMRPIRVPVTPASADRASRSTATSAAGHPASSPARCPMASAGRCLAASDIIVQVHYHPSGKAETDRTRIGLHFARKPIRQTLHWAAAANPGLELPPGNSNIEVKAAWPIPVDVVAYAVTPHMHLLGRDIAMSIKFPDGREQDLIKIDDWDFNWQYSYFFEKPLDLPKGSVLNVVAHYDNSAVQPP